MRAFTASDNVSHRSRSTAARCLCDAPEGLKNDMERTHLYSRTQGELPPVAQESDCSTCWLSCYIRFEPRCPPFTGRAVGAGGTQPAGRAQAAVPPGGSHPRVASAMNLPGTGVTDPPAQAQPTPPAQAQPPALGGC